MFVCVNHLQLKNQARKTKCTALYSMAHVIVFTQLNQCEGHFDRLADGIRLQNVLSQIPNQYRWIIQEIILVIFLLNSVVLVTLKYIFTLLQRYGHLFSFYLSGTGICVIALQSTICNVSGHICRNNAGQTSSTFRLSCSSLCISSVCFVLNIRKC